MARRSSHALAVELAAGVRQLRRRYRKRLARCQKEFTETTVHELRIETRRMLALLDLLRELDLGDELKRLRKIFKRRLDAFDPLRDAHVQLQMLKPLWRRFPEARDLDRWLRRQEKECSRELRHDVKAVRQRRLERRLQSLEKELRGVELRPPQVNAVVDQAFVAVERLRGKLRRHHPASIHRLRVAFKRFRYTCELLATLLPGLTRKRLRAMRDFQGRAGRIQDLTVLRRTLAQTAKGDPFARGELDTLDQHLRQEQQSLIDTFVQSLDALEDFHPDRLRTRPTA